jgi:hypothetical protein
MRPGAKDTGGHLKSCSDKAERESTPPNEHVVGIVLTETEGDSSQIAEPAQNRLSIQALVKQQISQDLQPCRENLRGHSATGHL